MTNYEIADIFTLYSKLSDIHGADAFKVKQLSTAAYNIEKVTAPLATMDAKAMAALKGIGASTANKIIEIVTTGQLTALETLLQQTPQGILEMMQIKGLGPKKIITIWEELEIESIGELLYACNENRLLLYKGFGAKNQHAIKEAIEFYQNAKGSFLYAQVEAIIPTVTIALENIFGASSVCITGDYIMQREVIDLLQYVINYPKHILQEKLATNPDFIVYQEKEDYLIYKIGESPLKLALYYGEEDDFAKKIFLTSGTSSFTEAFSISFPQVDFSDSINSLSLDDAIPLGGKLEQAIFAQAGIPYIPAYLREDASIIELAKHHKIPKPLQPHDIKGIIHNHSDWSDGTNTIEEMAQACIAKGMEYLVISDHSKSAYYAKGLTEDRIKAQHDYIDTLNNKFAPFRIFKSVECDILNDGSLDYSDAILSTFDMVIASVHSNLKMTEDKAMARIMAAIENPYTTILGHLSGRLLLSRPGYPLQYDKVIEACIDNNVVIELNAHPSRLDIDWRYIKNVLAADGIISIDPDAHNIEGFDDIRYGVLVAQKAMVQPHQNLSSFSLQELEEYIYEVRERKGV